MNSKGYKTLPFYVQSEIIHDFTVEFCSKYIEYKSRTKDQMEQAARSGKQNIAEGYGQQNEQGKIKLLKIARGSLEELLVDYQDFLRQKGLPLWSKENLKAVAVRNLVYKINKDNKSYNNYNGYNGYNNYNSYKNYNDYSNYNLYKDYLDNPEEAANTMICLINQTNMLLNRKIKWLEENASKGSFAESNSASPREKWFHSQLKKEREKQKGLDTYIQEIIDKKKKA